MEDDTEQETPQESLLRVVYIARSMEELNKVLLMLHEHGVSAYAFQDRNSFIPLPYMIRSYRVRIGVPVDEAKEAFIILKALELQAGMIAKSAVSDFKKTFLWSFAVGFLAFIVMLVYRRDLMQINYGVVFLIWIVSFFLISQILGYLHGGYVNSEDDFEDRNSNTE